MIYYPWNWGGRPAPDDALLTPMARSLAGAITTMRGDTSYHAEPGAALVGQSYPWLYGTLGTFDFIVETGLGAPFFPPHEVQGIVDANLNGVRTMLRRAEGPGRCVPCDRCRDGRGRRSHRVDTPDRNGRDPSAHHQPGHGHTVSLPPACGAPGDRSRPGYDTQILSGVTPPDSGWKRIEVPLTRTTH